MLALLHEILDCLLLIQDLGLQIHHPFLEMNFYLLGFGQLLLDLEPLEQRIRDLFPSDNPVMRLVRLYSRVESICAPHKLSMFCNSLQLFIYYA